MGWKNFFILFLWTAGIFAQQHPDTLEITKRSSPFSDFAEDFNNDTFPTGTLPRAFHWMGYPGQNEPEYVFRKLQGTSCWKWNHTGMYDFPSPFFLQSQRPFVRLNGSAGSRQWQFFNGIFSFPAFQGKGQHTVYLNRFGGQGFYARQQTFVNHFFVSSFLHSRRWGYTLSINHLKQKYQENGGILNDSISPADELRPKEWLAVKFYRANVRNALWEIEAMPYLILSEDSSKQQKIQLGLDQRLDQSQHFYLHDEVLKDNYYPAYFLDTLLTRDSIYHLRAGTGPRLIIRSSFFQVDFFYRYHFGKFYQWYDSSYRQGILGTGMTLKKNSLRAGIKGTFIAHGLFAGNYTASAEIHHTMKSGKSGRWLKAEILYASQAPPWIFIQQTGNHFQWKRNFFDVKIFQAEMLFSSEFLKGEILYQHIKNQYFVDELGYPYVWRSPVQRIRGVVSGTFRLWKIWKHEPSLIVQYADVPALFRFPALLPEYTSSSDVYLFRKNLRLQAGVNVRYIPSFVPYAYMPNTQLFYLKNVPESDEWWWISPFVAVRISPAQFYIRAENLMYLFVRRTPGWVYAYPQPGFWLHAGVCWDFRN